MERKRSKGKRVRVNVGKSKDVQLLRGRRIVSAKIDPCGVCVEIEWVHPQLNISSV